jgi:hypothetical protein
LALWASLLAGCGKGSARSWIFGPRAGEADPSGLSPMNAIDCPDGLARCEAGVVSVSRLRMIELPCSGPPSRCSCPWDRLPVCDRGCATEGVEVVVDRAEARARLCAPSADGGTLSP